MPPAAIDYGKKLYEGKAKIVYQTAEGTLIHYFKDSATAFNAEKKGEFAGKGELNCEMSSFLFEFLQSKDLPTHFLRRIDARSLESEALSMLPVEVVVRNIVAGSLAKRLKEEEGRVIRPPIVEFFLKDDAKGDPLVSEDILISLYEMKRADLEEMKALALQVNEQLLSLTARAQLKLVDFKLEFGRNREGRILIADEVSPDTCRFWDAATNEKLDKDRFRFDLGNLVDGYRIVLERLKGALVT